jgi:hypothetical protein
VVLAATERDLIRVVSEDLDFIAKDWDQSVEDASLRRSSTVLRRLLVDGHFGKAWRSLGLEKQPSVRAPDLGTTIDSVADSGKIVFAQAGGARFRGVEVQSVLEYAAAMSPQEIQRRFTANPEPPLHTFSLSRFLNSPAFVVQGSIISRQHVVQYVSNKLGGAHFDPDRNMQDKVERLFAALDQAGARYFILEKPAVYFELLSIGQVVAQSEDAHRLIELAAGVS